MGDIIKNLYEAKTELSSLVERAAKGEEFVIAKNGVPLAKLVPLPSTKGKRKMGCAKGKIWIADDFHDPLPDEILATLEEPIEPPPGHARIPVVVPGKPEVRKPRPRRRRRS